MKSTKNWGKFIVSLGSLLVLLAGCGNESGPELVHVNPIASEDITLESAPSDPVASEDTSTESATAEPVTSKDTSPQSTPADPIASEDISPEPTPKASAENNSLIKHHSTEHEYNHGEDGYYNLLDDGVEFELTAQLDGTCWVYASACSMMTSYQLDHDGVVVLDQIDLLNEIYSDDKEEGIFTVNGANKKSVGGEGLFVINELANGFGDGFVLDGAIDAKNWTIDEVKEGIRKYGALYIGIPDPSNKKGTYDNYYTLNCPSPKDGDFDHSIAILGWDDSFPKEYYREEASWDGAWIAYNSSHPLGYYYVSYDTPFDQLYDTPLFMSITDGYSKVLSYDCGKWFTEPIRTGDVTTTANVFSEKGTLAAVGTYSPTDDADLTIQIMTPDLSECLYSQVCHADHAGYYVFELDSQMEVDEYAIAISYPEGAPVEGTSIELDPWYYTDITIKSGQSFVLIDDKWLDMSEESTWNQFGYETNNACIKALYVK